MTTHNQSQQRHQFEVISRDSFLIDLIESGFTYGSNATVYVYDTVLDLQHEILVSGQVCLSENIVYNVEVETLTNKFDADDEIDEIQRETETRLLQEIQDFISNNKYYLLYDIVSYSLDLEELRQI